MIVTGTLNSKDLGKPRDKDDLIERLREQNDHYYNALDTIVASIQGRPERFSTEAHLLALESIARHALRN